MDVSPHSGASRRQDRRRGLRITERDQALLEFAAEHRLILAAHAQTLLGVCAPAASARVGALARAGLLRQDKVFAKQPPCYQITRAGLAVAASDLTAPRLDLRSYDHDIGVAWLWLAARAGTWGRLEELVSERQMRSQDALRTTEPAVPPAPDRGTYGIRLGGVGAHGRERLHYPDLMLTLEGGWRVAVELELTSKGRTRREKILRGYGADFRVDAVLYLVEDPAVARAVAASARRLGISDRVHVQPVRMSAPARRGGAGLAAERARAQHASDRPAPQHASDRPAPQHASDRPAPQRAAPSPGREAAL